MKLETDIRLRSVLFAALAAAVALALFVPDSSGAQTQSKPEQKKQAEQKEPGQKKKEDEAETIRLNTQLVNVLFAVQDKQNRYINDITREELTVLENGKPQEISTFKKEFDLPLTMALMVDVSGSEQFVLPMLKDAGARFIESVIRQNKDTAAVIKFEGEATLMQGLTSNRARLRKALEEIAYIGPPPGGVFGGTTPPINGGSRQGGTSMYDSVIAACDDLLAREPGRKTIILITDGEDTTSRLKIGDALDSALRAEVVIYAIGIGEGHVNEGALKRLCEETGGRAFIPRSRRDLEDGFAQLETDLRQQYLLAYEPANEANDGSFRKIEVRAANRKDVRIRHRKGYYAPKG